MVKITKIRIETLLEILKDIEKEGTVYVDIVAEEEGNKLKIISTEYKSEEDDLNNLTKYVI